MSTSWQQWIGRKQLASDCISKSPLLAMRSTLEGILGCPEEQTVPPLWHWLYFLDKPPQTQLAQDGHEKRGKYMPPITLPRRMWAASQLQFLLPLKVDDLVTRESVINSIETKQGKSGALAFVTIDHKISAESGLAIIEKQTIVYRGQAAGKPARKKVTEKADFEKTVNPTILLLFRYSALTFNAHRIHYDREYACNEEGYPGLVVHGPLLATLLIGALQENYPEGIIKNFEFRALKPVFDLTPFTICGQNPDQEGHVKLWISDNEGDLCMQATAVLKKSEN